MKLWSHESTGAIEGAYRSARENFGKTRKEAADTASAIGSGIAAVVGTVAIAALWLAVVGGMVYALVRFVKWAWAG